MKKRFKYLSCLLAVLFSLVLCFLLRSEPPIASEEIRGKATFTTQIQATSNRLQSRSPGATDPLRDFQKTDFYRTIVDNNLFRPLGWRPARPREPYRLLGTLLPNDGETPPQAILQSTTARTTYIVRIGDKLDKATTVTDIQPKEIMLETNGKQRTLGLNTSPMLK